MVVNKIHVEEPHISKHRRMNNNLTYLPSIKSWKVFTLKLLYLLNFRMMMNIVEMGGLGKPDDGF